MTVDIEIDGKSITVKVYVADNDLLQEDFLLGQDVIISAYLELNFESGDSKIKRSVHQPTTRVSTNIAKLLENFENDKESKQMRSLLEKFADGRIGRHREDRRGQSRYHRRKQSGSSTSPIPSIRAIEENREQNGRRAAKAQHHHVVNIRVRQHGGAHQEAEW